MRRRCIAGVTLAGVLWLTPVAPAPVTAASGETLYYAARQPDDACFVTCPVHLGGQRNLRAIGATAAWEVTIGSPDVVVAVLDTAVDAAHAELRGKVTVGPDLRPDLGCTAADPILRGHGTAVASVVAASTDDGVGIASIGWATSILAIPVLDDCGVGTATSVATGIRVAIASGAHVLNLSLTGPADPAVGDAVAEARAHGVLVVAAAGNDGRRDESYPAAYDDVIAVTSTDRTNERLSAFATRGGWVDLGAPGEDVLAASTVGGGYWVYEGSSFAAPLVAGSAALLLAVHPHFDADDLEHSLAQSARRIDGVAWGALDAGELLEQHTGALVLAEAHGGVITYGSAAFHGSAAGLALVAPIVGVATTPGGYLLAGADGGVFTFGRAPFHGSAVTLATRTRVVGIVASPSGAGYWLVADDGGVFAFGDAPFLGSAAGLSPGSPVVAMAVTPSGRGYWLAAADGGVFTFGDAGFAGSVAVGAGPPIVGITAAGSAAYRIVDSWGTVRSFGAAPPLPQVDRGPWRTAVVGIASEAHREGYWIVTTEGQVVSFGHVLDDGRAWPRPSARIVGIAAA